MEHGTFKLTNPETGEEKVYSILFTFDSEETKKSYMVYTDGTTDPDGTVQVLASVYNPEEENPELLPVETDREWVLIEKLLESISEDVERQVSQEEQ